MRGSDIGAIILAAGASARLGEPKQLLAWRGKPLVVRAAGAVLETGAAPVIVVVGAHGERVRAPLAGLAVRIVENAVWREGMGASVRAGMTAMPESVDGVMIALCDQPFFNAQTAGRLFSEWQKKSATSANRDRLIIASRYENRAGVPVIFGKGYYRELQTLAGDEGAKRILKLNTQHVVTIDLPELAADIDTPGDWARLRGIL